MKKIISLLMSVAIVIGMIPAMASATTDTGWDGVTTTAPTGSGTSSDPYKIANAAQLAYMRDWVNEGTNCNKYYELTADIDLNNKEWVPIGRDYDSTPRTHFAGTFDGNGYAVKNIKITTYRAYNGLFGDVFSATIKELGVENANIEVSGGGGSHGAMAGRATGTFTDCYVKNSSVRNVDTGEKYEAVGGFLGRIRTKSTFTNCYVYNTTVGGTYRSSQGGFFGISQNKNTSVLTNCYTAKINFEPLVEGNGAACYGFGRLAIYNAGTAEETIDEITAVNCWSTETSAAGRSESNTNFMYKPEWVLGTDGATREGIVNALVDGTNSYTVDNSINNGYPCLNFEGWSGEPAAEIGGSGTESDPYVIYNAAQLAKARDMINSGTYNADWYELRADIDLNNVNWEPIGLAPKYIETETIIKDDGTETKKAKTTSEIPFRGHFNGNNHIIKNIKIAAAAGDKMYTYYGLFGSVSGGTITNLGVENIDIKIGNSNDYDRVTGIGGLAGLLNGTVENCYVKNSSIKMTHMGAGYDTVGGFIGVIRRLYAKTSVKNCYTYNVKIHAGRRGTQGGFIGSYMNSRADYLAEVENCYSAEVRTDTTDVTMGSNTTPAFYAFSRCPDTYTSYVNCWSASSDAVQANPNETYASAIYNKDYSMGTVGATAGTIESNLVKSNSAFKTDSALNGDFPALSWETAEVENPYVISAVSSGNNMKITLAQRTAVAGAKVYLAAYSSSGRLLDAQSLDAKAGTQTTTVSNTSAAEVKAFVWDGELTPIAESYTGIPLEDGQMAEQLRALPGGDEEVEITRKTRLVMMGDSIMDSVLNTSGSQWNKTGWEKHIGTYLNDDIAVVKHGHSGNTIQYFMEGRTSYHTCSWETIKNQFGEGDYIILSLGANDNSRLAGTHQTESFTEDYFVESYKKIIADVEAKGAKVIICTPIPTNGNYNSSTGRFVSDSIFPISRQALARVVAETGVECIDLATLYTDALNKLIDDGVYTGDEMRITKTNGTITAPGVIYVDDTHTSDLGSQLLAEIVAKAIKDTSETGLEDYIVLE